MELTANSIVALNTRGDASNASAIALWLDKKSIIEIAIGVFDKFTKLERLDLERNRIAVLPKDVFHSLKELRVINLFKNKIKVLEPDLFRENKKLEVIRVWANQVTTLDDALFSNLPALQKLYFGENRIKTFNFGCLKDSPRLTELSFCFNELSEMNELNDFSTLFPQLELCDVQYNNFSCSYLMTVIESLEGQRIGIVELDKRKGIKDASIYGIKCIPDAIYSIRKERDLELLQPNLEAKNNQLRVDLDLKEAEIKMLTAENEELREGLANNKQENTELRENLQKTNLQLERMLEKIQDMQQEQLRAEELIRRCEEKIDILESERDKKLDEEQLSYALERPTILSKLIELRSNISPLGIQRHDEVSVEVSLNGEQPK